MDQEKNTSSNENNAAPPAMSSDSMSPGKDSNGDGSNAGSPAGLSAADKGKGVVVVKQEAEEGGSEGNKRVADAAADVGAADGSAAKVPRANGRRGDRDVHIITERERRKRMSEMFSKLHSLLPSIPDKVDKSSIVLEAIQFIKRLEGTVGDLEKRKLEKDSALARCNAANGGVSTSVAAATAAPPLQAPILQAGGQIWQTPVVQPAGPVTVPIGLQTWSATNVVLSLSGDDAYINVCVARRQGVLTMVASVLDKHSIDVVTTTVSSDGSRSMFTIHARLNGMIRQFGHNMPSEEIYKLAVSEIMVWLADYN